MSKVTCCAVLATLMVAVPLAPAFAGPPTNKAAKIAHYYMMQRRAGRSTRSYRPATTYTYQQPQAAEVQSRQATVPAVSNDESQAVAATQVDAKLSAAELQQHLQSLEQKLAECERLCRELEGQTVSGDSKDSAEQYAALQKALHAVEAEHQVLHKNLEARSQH